MRRATSLIRRTDIGGRIAVDSITLDRQSRHRRRVLLETDRGHEVLLDLAEAAYMAHGDLLALENGTCIKIIAAAEPLLEIHAPTGTDLRSWRASPGTSATGIHPARSPVMRSTSSRIMCWK